MNEHDDKPRLASAEAPNTPERKSGRVVFDNDGRSVWEWQTATGVFTRNVTDDQLTSLATVELELDETAKEITSAKVFSTSRRPTPAGQPTSQPRTRTKKDGVAAWLMRAWHD